MNAGQAGPGYYFEGPAELDAARAAVARGAALGQPLALPASPDDHRLIAVSDGPRAGSIVCIEPECPRCCGGEAPDTTHVVVHGSDHFTPGQLRSAVQLHREARRLVP